MKEIRLHGRGGQGVVVAGEVMSSAMIKEGKYCSIFPRFGIARRGTNVLAYARESDQPIREKSKIYHPDILMVFDQILVKNIEETFEGFPEGGIIVINSTNVDEILATGVKPSKIVMIDGKRIANETLGRNIPNMIMLGTLCRAIDDVSLDSMIQAMKEGMSPKLAAKNEIAMKRGYEEAQIFEYDYKKQPRADKPLFLQDITTCTEPPKPKYEATWGDTTTEYQVSPTGSWRFKRPVVDKNNCIKCGICQKFCPIQCIVTDENGYYNANYDYCKGCGVCANECPKKTISMQLEENF